MTRRTLRCDSCEPLAINGFATHEHGCPESWKDPSTGKGYLRECQWCGSTFTPEAPGQNCCDASCYQAWTT